MRKGNKSKVLMIVLALSLALNAFALAAAADDPGFEVLFDFEELPDVDETAIEEVQLDEDINPISVDALEADDEVTVLADDEEGQNVVPGNIITYNGKMYKIPNEAPNLITNGTFENQPTIITGYSSNTDVMILDGNGSYSWSESAAHTGTRGLRITGDGANWIYRHEQNKGKLYVYSCWVKLEGNANFDNGYRHIAGTQASFDQGGSYYIEIGRDIPITGGWQQIFVVYRCGDTTKFSNFFKLVGSGAINVDDMVLYEIEEVDETITVDGGYAVNMETFDIYEDEIPEGGDYYFVISYSNKTPYRYNVTGVVAVMKDDKLEKIYTYDQISSAGSLVGGALQPKAGEIFLEVSVPKDADMSRYSFVSYVTEQGNPFGMFGIPSDSNPFVINGKGHQR